MYSRAVPSLYGPKHAACRTPGTWVSLENHCAVSHSHLTLQPAFPEPPRVPHESDVGAMCLLVHAFTLAEQLSRLAFPLSNHF